LTSGFDQGRTTISYRYNPALILSLKRIVIMKTFSTRVAAWWLASLLLTQTGCSLLTADYKNMKEPKVSLAGLNIKDLNPLSPSFLVRLKVDNPNDLDVNLDGADVALALNGRPVAAGVSRSPLVLKKLGSSEMDVEVTANTMSAIQQFLILQTQPNLDYQVTGNLIWNNWLGALGKLPLKFSGSMDKDTLMRAASSLAR
jgi:LEA14-like dessication related protein